jgi:hypothetical protein
MKTILKAAYLAAGLAVALSGCASSSPKMSNFAHRDERFIPAGTSASVQLEQGVTVRNRDDANPARVLFTMTDASKFLRGAEYVGSSCNILGSAVGDAVTKRMDITVERLSCVDADGVPVVSVATQGYVYGKDKASGLPARIEETDGRQVLTVDGDQPATVVISEDVGFRFGK